MLFLQVIAERSSLSRESAYYKLLQLYLLFTKPTKGQYLTVSAAQSSTQNYPCESLLEGCQMYLPFFPKKYSKKDSKIAHFFIHS